MPRILNPQYAQTSTLPAPVRVCTIAIGAYLYGFLTAHVPAPRTDETIFWVSNLAAPYVVIPFLAGAWRFRAVAASAVGSLGAGAAVAGFYNFLMVGDVTNSQMDLPVTTTAREVVLRAYGNWFRNFLWGDPGGRPWLSIAIISGLVFGHLGYRWRHNRSRFAGAVPALALILEPVARVSGLAAGIAGSRGLHTSNIVIWSIEALIGTAALVWVWRVDRDQHPSGPS